MEAQKLQKLANNQNRTQRYIYLNEKYSRFNISI